MAGLSRFRRLVRTTSMLLVTAVSLFQASPRLAAQEAALSPANGPGGVEQQAAEQAAAPLPVFPLAVMVDNFPAARPQTGLANANIVYEALAEGGITRFLAIFAGGEPELVGPIRSTRHYYVYWAAEYNAPLVHVMASDRGYAALVNTGLSDLDEHRGDSGFQRSPDRPMPFNTYTSPAFARQVLASHGALWPGSLGGLTRVTPPRLVRGTRAGSMHVDYPLAGYSVDWAYDAAERRYLRSQAGAPHLDAASGQQIGAKTVIVQFVPAWVFERLGGEDYLDMQLEGAGRAVYFQNGLAVEGTWRKQSYATSTSYLGPDGKPIAFAPGPLWVQVVPTGSLEGALTYGRSALALCSVRTTLVDLCPNADEEPA